MKQVDTARELFRKVDATSLDDNEFSFHTYHSPSERGDDVSAESVRKKTVTDDDNPEQILEQSVDRTVSSIDEIDSDKYDSLYVGNEYTFVANSEMMGYEVEMKSGVGYAVMLPDMLVAIPH